MKKLICFFIAVNSLMIAQAQDSTKKKHINYDADLPGWVFDINLKGGMLTQDAGKYNMARNYLNAISGAGISDIKFNNGTMFGADGQLGYFFGKSRHFGVGVGFSYIMQNYDITLDRFRIEYQSNDYRNDVFRQVISSAGQVKEKVSTTNLNIPVVLKYKTHFNEKWGFTMDAGILFNMQMTNKYSTNAAFNYEAIYKYDVDGNGNATAVYDNGTTPSSRSILLTRDYILTKNPGASVVDTFAKFRAQGYNVGLNIPADRKEDNVTYKTGSIGFLVQPSVTYMLTNNIDLTLGAFYVYQTFQSEKSTDGYKLTNGVGQYNSMLRTVSTTTQNNIGVNLGLRFYFGKMKDKDKDGVADKRDDCPEIPGPKFFHGCPDRDGDSIIDAKDKCPDDKGLAKYDGCPDRDGDGLIDRDDVCPDQAGKMELKGCPDRDGDGVADKDDACPDTKGLEAFHGCPDTDGDGISDNNDACPTVAGPAETNGCPDKDHDGVVDDKDKCPDVPGPASNEGCPLKLSSLNVDKIQFKTGTYVITTESYQILDEAVEVLNADQEVVLHIVGHADITGSSRLNKRLSKQRAEAVKKYFVKKGVSVDRLFTDGRSSDEPIDSNETKDGRAKNRRVEMSLERRNK
jgi:outer membrane protein OmpA-like peptidoglycan-associated protein